MTLRGTFKSLTPPIVRDLRHGGRCYPSWAAAASKAASSYDDADLNAFKAARAALRPIDGTILTSNVLHLTALALQKPDLSVTDFGGSTGDLGDDFLAAFPNATYVVVETPSLVAMMKGRRRVKFENAVPSECDVFFSSGTLQYIGEPMAVLSSGFASARRAVVLTRNSFSDEELFRVQRSKLFANGSGPVPSGHRDAIVRYPHRTINERAVNEIANQYGFPLRHADRGGEWHSTLSGEGIWQATGVPALVSSRNAMGRRRIQ